MIAIKCEEFRVVRKFRSYLINYSLNDNIVVKSVGL